jgi:hypothetical protein
MKNNTEKDKNGITLKELIDRGIVDKHYHLKEQRFVGGLTMPEKGSTDWWKRVDD